MNEWDEAVDSEIDSIPSPCINKCEKELISPTDYFCKGCKRSKEEITNWGIMRNEEKEKILYRLRGGTQ